MASDTSEIGRQVLALGEQYHHTMTLENPLHANIYAAARCSMCGATVVARKVMDQDEPVLEIAPLFTARPIPTCAEVAADEREQDAIIRADVQRKYGPGRRFTHQMSWGE